MARPFTLLISTDMQVQISFTTFQSFQGNTPQFCLGQKTGIKLNWRQTGPLRGNHALWSSEGWLGRGGYFPTLTTLAACTRHPAVDVFFFFFLEDLQVINKQRKQTPPTPQPPLAPAFIHAKRRPNKAQSFPPFGL